MNTAERPTPQIKGFTPQASHLCPRCGTLARILYRNNGQEVDRPSPAPGYREIRFVAGALLIENEHHDGGNGANSNYFGHCGLVLPALGDTIESFVNQLYMRLHPNHYGFSYTPQSQDKIIRKRIINFDRVAFLNSPWMFLAPAREPGEAPVYFMACPSLIQTILATGSVPPPGSPSKIKIPKEEQFKLTELFLEMIGAVTEDRNF